LALRSSPSEYQVIKKYGRIQAWKRPCEPGHSSFQGGDQTIFHMVPAVSRDPEGEFVYLAVIPGAMSVIPNGSIGNVEALSSRSVLPAQFRHELFYFSFLEGT
jgi:hypothetical protein